MARLAVKSDCWPADVPVAVRGAVSDLIDRLPLGEQEVASAPSAQAETWTVLTTG